MYIRHFFYAFVDWDLNSQRLLMETDLNIYKI